MDGKIKQTKKVESEGARNAMFKNSKRSHRPYPEG